VYKGYNGTAVKTVAFMDSSITGNAATATAFASSPAKCPAGNYPMGIDASGNAQNCTSPAGNGDSAGQTIVPFSTTPTYAVGKNSFEAQKLTLTANVTSSTLTVASGNPLVELSLCQDGTGGRTNVWPINVIGAPQISADPNACTNVSGSYDGSNLNVSSYSITNDAAAPALIYQTNGTTYTQLLSAKNGTVATLADIAVSVINGTSVPVNSASDQFLGTTASAAAAWASIPNCADTSGNHLNYVTSTHTFSCGTSDGGSSANYWTSATHTGIGGAFFTPSNTLNVLDSATTVNIGYDGSGTYTGAHTSATTTGLTIVAGQAQGSGNPLLLAATNTGAGKFGVFVQVAAFNTYSNFRTNPNTGDMVITSTSGSPIYFNYDNTNGDLYLGNTSNSVFAGSGTVFKFTNGTSAAGTPDVGIGRDSSAVLAVNCGAGGTYCNLKLQEIVVNGEKSTTGMRFACLDTSGKIVSSTTACSGT